MTPYTGLHILEWKVPISLQIFTFKAMLHLETSLRSDQQLIDFHIKFVAQILIAVPSRLPRCWVHLKSSMESSVSFFIIRAISKPIYHTRLDTLSVQISRFNLYVAYAQVPYCMPYHVVIDHAAVRADSITYL